MSVYLVVKRSSRHARVWREFREASALGVRRLCVLWRTNECHRLGLRADKRASVVVETGRSCLACCMMWVHSGRAALRVEGTFHSGPSPPTLICSLLSTTTIGCVDAQRRDEESSAHIYPASFYTSQSSASGDNKSLLPSVAYCANSRPSTSKQNEVDLRQK